MRTTAARGGRCSSCSNIRCSTTGPSSAPTTTPGTPAAPARREDLTGLPPAWIGVGTLNIFHDEDVEYARRLNESGVPCELVVVPGAFHGFDVAFKQANVTREFRAAQHAALRAAFGS